MTIKLLPQDLINKIAAGEVVERPASVVKELVENSLDAGASNIEIELNNGGINMIKVADNGFGMNREDAELSLTQHATSKISSDEDLYNIESLGFRGEALASISSISEFELITKDDSSDAGTKIKVDSTGTKIEDVGSAQGTAITIENIFYNVPARQKYLKTAVTEFNHIVDLFFRYCLSYPNVSWRLTHNGKIVYHFPGTEDLHQRISDILGDEIANQLVKVDVTISGLRVSGYIGKPQAARHNRKLQYLSINKRPVSEFIVSKQVKNAFTTLISRDQYPVYILDLEIKNDEVDVNVHPRKLEVRFSDPQKVYRTIYQAITRTLDENELSRVVSQEDMGGFVSLGDVLKKKQTKMNPEKVSQPASPEPTPAVKPPSPQMQEAIAEFKELAEEVEKLSDGNEKIDEVYVEDFRVLGQVDNSYIVVEADTGIKLYDQHASSERVQYEKLKNEWQIGTLSSQKMLIPENIELTPQEATLVNNNFELFARLGYELEAVGGNTFMISALPQFLVKQNSKELILKILGELSETAIVEDKISEPIDAILKMMSCRSAIKFGDTLSHDGMRQLIIDLEKLDNQYTCVHGRPVMLEFKFDELLKLFKRK